MKTYVNNCKGFTVSGLGTLVRKYFFMVNSETFVRKSEGKKDEILNAAF